MASMGAVTFTYDALDRVVAQSGGNGYVVVYGPDGGKLALLNGTTGAVVKMFAPLPGGATAVYNSSGLAYYRHSDWLGSARLSSSPTRAVLSTAAYGPFGENYAQSGSADLSFTGQNQDTQTGFFDFTFRELSASQQGRWISPDPAGLKAVSLTNPQTWNRYAYVGNSPLNAVDPLGLFHCPAPDKSGDPDPHFFCAGDGWENSLGPCSMCGTDNSLAVLIASGFLGSLNTFFGAASQQNEEAYLKNVYGSSVTSGPGGFSYLLKGPSFWGPCDAAGGASGAPCGMLTVNYFEVSLGGLRSPDFISLNVNFGIPYLANLVGPTVALNLDRKGNLYIGGGANVGKAATLVSGSLTANWLTQGGAPSSSQLNAFLTKNSLNVTAGYWGGLQGTWTPGSGFAAGGGFVTPQIGAAWTYSWSIANLGVGW